MGNDELSDGELLAPRDEQIRAILGWNVFRWAVARLPEGTSISDVRFRDFITVTPQEVLEHVAEHGFPDDVVALGPESRAFDEGQCIVPAQDGRWWVYYAERGTKRDEGTFSSLAQAQRFVVDKLYDSARTALNHRWWHAHPDERPPRIADVE